MNFSKLFANFITFTHEILPLPCHRMTISSSSIIFDLPDEILREIFLYLNRRDLNSIRSSCRHFHFIVHSKPSIGTKRIIDNLAIVRTELKEIRIVTICMEERKTIVSSYSQYFKNSVVKKCLHCEPKIALGTSTRIYPINEISQGNKHLENVLAASRETMKSIPKQGYDPNILVKQAMKRIQNVMVGGFLEKLTLFELSLDGEFLRSMYNCIRVNSRVITIEMINCDLTRVTRQHLHDFLVSYSPREISITLNSEQIDLNRRPFWIYPFFHKCIENGVQKLKLTPHRSVTNPQHINGLDDNNFANLSVFRSLEIRQVDVSGVGIRRLIEAYLLTSSHIPIEAFILTISNFSLNTLLPYHNYNSTQSRPILPPGSSIPDSIFLFTSPTVSLRVKIEYNGRFVSIRSIKGDIHS